MSHSSRRQSGFTLIELMVVMAIIAILATAGLSAYTGYIKKARDAKRIADISAINNVVLGSLSSTGFFPLNGKAVAQLVTEANNGQLLMDPMIGTAACLGGPGGDEYNPGSSGFYVFDTDPNVWSYINVADTGSNNPCGYFYTQCDNGLGFAVSTSFESASNKPLYAQDPLGPALAITENILGYSIVNADLDSYYSIGSCREFYVRPYDENETEQADPGHGLIIDITIF